MASDSESASEIDHGTPSTTVRRAAPGTVRRGGRTAVVQQKVFDATLTTVARVGYAALSIDAVAEAATVNKTTIYRRWRTKDALIAAAISELLETTYPVPDSGSLDDDVRSFSRGVVDLLLARSPQLRGAVRALFSDSARDTPLGTLKREFFQRRYERAAAMVEAAKSRGELPPDTDAQRVIALAAAPIYNRFLVTGEPIDEAFADDTAADALIAARAGACRPRT